MAGRLTAAFNHLEWTWPLNIIDTKAGHAVSFNTRERGSRLAGFPAMMWPLIQTCWPYKGKLSKTLSNLPSIQPPKKKRINRADSSSFLPLVPSAPQWPRRWRVSCSDNVAIYHGDETNYWLRLTVVEEWESTEADFGEPVRSAGPTWLDKKRSSSPDPLRRTLWPQM